MDSQVGRRERKKAATRSHIAEVALRLFAEHGYDEVGLRDVAREADVAVTTVFAHFSSKEALVFDEDETHEEQLVGAVVNRSADQSLLDALRAQALHSAQWFRTPKSTTFWALVESSAALRGYAAHMRARHEQALVAAIAADPQAPASAIACRALARFALDVHSLARDAQDPTAAVEESFDLIEHGFASAIGRGGR
ncbi:Transcriptional regulator, TetR family [Actinokineospora spheciospongiae]|uniref:Transcriptional regulator, TetR family n=1 Tax=Actinokineospora spheciospongiae TaxID=909613 RepID=W7J2A1_9PSEU|nr:TetR/AcrR family transcriptional regulator [Actinokineospora spheciospongiae]EWC60264.1 Transcriptional regulator, TetR family [Actinokineospora spheciospongiae]PWW52730.1 TetR family transcriptional regulator [Actinokineospora spheciospongiae]